MLILKQSLLLDPCQEETYNIRLAALDGGSPAKKSPEAFVTITIGRNRFAPDFQKTPYTTKIRENLEMGRGVFSVTATDRDTKVRWAGELMVFPSAVN